MILINSAEKPMSPCCVAVGYFDGMHLGHRKVLERTLELAKENGLSPAVLSFNMSCVRASGKGRSDLLSLEQRLSHIRELGFDSFIYPSFEQIKDLSEEEFVKTILKERLDAKTVVCGDNFRFGKGRSGDVDSLKRLCEEEHISVYTVPALILNGEPVSTTRIKALMEEGDIKSANELLGFEYSVTGTVIKGNRLAHKLGFPTANIDMDPTLFCPKRGVYLSVTVVDGCAYKSITNIGTRPTVTEDVQPTCETNLLDFDGDLYSKHIKVVLLDFMRPEKIFTDIEELKETVLSNIVTARNTEIDLNKYISLAI